MKPASTSAAPPGWPSTVALFGLELSRMTFCQTLDWLDACILRQPTARACIFSANVDQLVRLDRDPAFREAYRTADLVLPDGMPVVWSSRLLKKAVPERVAGIDLLLGLCHLGALHGYPCFLLGGRGMVTADASTRLVGQFPGLQICGWHHGYFRDEGGVVAQVNAVRPDILFVGMGSPLQENWLRANFSRLSCRLAVAVGGAFEVLAGKRRRAPLPLQQAGLEWAWRLAQEPQRLWRRYLWDDLKFVPLMLRQLRRPPGR